MNLEEINGVGPKTISLLNKLGITDINSLVSYYPYRYDVIKKSDITNMSDNEKIITCGIVESKPTIMYLNKGIKKISFRINADSKLLNIHIYNRIYLANELKIGTQIIVIGKYNKSKNAIVAEEVRFGTLSDIPQIEPVYYTTYGLSRKILAKIINNSLTQATYQDTIPTYLKERYNFIDKKIAINQIHNPTDIILLKKAKLYLKYEELFNYMLKINYLKIKNKNTNEAITRNIDKEKINNFINNLPFTLTPDQITTVNEIINDLEQNIRMNRLVQGDVGSGKTIVAFISSYANYLSGYQTALMVPTEILANQHYESALKLFKDYNINIALLTSNTKARDKKETITKLQEGNIDLIIGTQSLIQENIKYNNLGLVITDEQHRFGVNQRKQFKDKGKMPDVISMSATPIPRTYALTIYGDLDVSSIKTKPVGRKEIITKHIKENNITTALQMMNKELKEEHQIYVIAPLINSEEETELESVISLKEKMNKAFGSKYKIDIIHGKLTSQEKDEVMENFNNKKIDILISTTVIEVGVDVKNATMIVIFDANNFGLSTLHQLRGRVGRSNLQSYCLLITKNDCERLKILEQTNDGFLVSEYDFENRGEGDLFGIRQSGEKKFNIANIHSNYKILLKAKEDAYEVLTNNSLNENIIKKLQEVNDLE